MFDIIGVPFDLTGFQRGSALGPAAIRYADLEAVLEGMGLDVRDRGDLPHTTPYTAEGGLRNFQPMLETVKLLRGKAAETLAERRIPLIVGGDHMVAAGGISAGLAHYGEGLAVVWIDAHTDVNTPGSSDTGNLHGMPVAALAGLPSEAEGQIDAEWSTLLAALGPGPCLSLERTAWYAIRDVDPAERGRLKGLALTMHDIDRHGVVATMANMGDWLKEIGATHLWISFDVDSMDPILAPGTGTAVRGGLSYREAHLCAELLCEMLDGSQCSLAGLDVVETNPLVDHNNSTAVMVVEWIASLLGKTILGMRR